MALPKIVLPMIAGLSLGYRDAIEEAWVAIILGVLLAVCAQWALVLLNDYADREADAQHAISFPELLDVRVLPLGMLTPGSVLMVGLLAAVGVLSVSGALYWLGRPQALWLGAAGLLLLWAYSFSPLKLNYRGGGEILETLGAGVLLPLTGYYIGSGRLDFAHAHLLIPVLLYAFIGALASGLKHEPADLANGKKTLCVLLGAVTLRRFIWGAQMAARLCCGLFFLSGEYGWYAVSLGALATALPMYWTRRYDSRADYSDLHALGKYKKSLVQASYLTYAALVLDFLLVV